VGFTSRNNSIPGLLANPECICLPSAGNLTGTKKRIPQKAFNPAFLRKRQAEGFFDGQERSHATIMEL